MFTFLLNIIILIRKKNAAISDSLDQIYISSLIIVVQLTNREIMQYVLSTYYYISHKPSTDNVVTLIKSFPMECHTIRTVEYYLIVIISNSVHSADKTNN